MEEEIGLEMYGEKNLFPAKELSPEKLCFGWNKENIFYYNMTQSFWEVYNKILDFHLTIFAVSNTSFGFNTSMG